MTTGLDVERVWSLGYCESKFAIPLHAQLAAFHYPLTMFLAQQMLSHPLWFTTGPGAQQSQSGSADLLPVIPVSATFRRVLFVCLADVDVDIQ